VGAKLNKTILNTDKILPFTISNEVIGFVFNVSKVELLYSSVNILIDIAGTNKTNKIGVKVKKEFNDK
tara:strand:+ start:71 stop:274 length:204 start_codon:yes stop_codon:yes gene_type:complete